LQEEIKDKGISIYPNPTTGQLHITMGHAPLWEDAVIEIYSVVGQKLLSAPFNSPEWGKLLSFGGAVGGLIIDVSHLANGMYFIAIYSDGQKIIRKFVKN